MIVTVAIGFAGRAAQERDAATALELHTVEVLDVTWQMRVAVLDALRGERGYLLVGEHSFLEPYRKSVTRIEIGKAELEHLLARRPGHAERLAFIEGRLDYHVGTLGNIIALAKAGRRDEALDLVARGQGRRTTDLVLLELDEFEALERELLARRKAVRERKARAAEAYELLLAFAGILLLGVGVSSVIAMRQSLEREDAARRELERVATTDELTGLANRRETHAALARLIAAERRHGRPLSLAVIDIDHFKRVNDAHGHPAGDEVIRRVGEIATQAMREQDLVGRIGGEEFIVVLPDTDAAHALLACDRLRGVIAATRLVLENGQALRITLSAGVAQLVSGDDQATLIARADEALYAAKSAGRDRVRLAA